jgi:sulfite reductase beta subunit-like hemoprotein
MRPNEQDFRAGFEAHGRFIEAYRRGELAPGEWRPIRLSYGLYYQLDHTSHMQRIKIPGGLLSARQLEVVADIADRYARGVAHITTRQDFQFHWIELDSVLDIYERLHAVGISTRGACADSIRNVTGCPDAGVDPAEAFDVTPHVLAVHTYFLFNPLNLTLPRKFKIGVSGCEADCAQASINDIGLYAHRRGEELGFAVYAGGGLSSQPFLARRVRDFLPARDLLIMCEAIVRVQHRYGERKNRHKARMKYLVKTLGEKAFVAAVETEFARTERERGGELRDELEALVRGYKTAAPALPAGGSLPADGPAARWARTNTRAQGQAGYRTAIVVVPVGDLTGSELRGLAALARRFGNATVRLTNEQNVIVPWIPDGQVEAVHAELTALGLAEPNALHLSDVVSCPGMDYCSLAMTRSMGVAAGMRSVLHRANGGVEAIGELRVKVSGCPNACGQHHVGDIGLTGVLSKDADGIERPHYSILVGGSVGERASRLGRRLVGRYREEVAPLAVEAVARVYAAERQPGERFAAFVDRVGVDRLSEVAQAAAREEAAA